MQFRTMEEILDFAIRREEEAAALYSSLADSASRPGMREALQELAGEEERHRERLLRVKAGELPAVTGEQVKGLGLAETLEAPAFSPGMTYPEILRFAMQAEKAAFRLYMGLAELAPPVLAEVLRSLATEEARHKLRLETEYDDHVLEGV